MVTEESQDALCHRVDMIQLAMLCLAPPFTAPLLIPANLLGLQVTGFGIGFRSQVQVGVGLTGTVGNDTMFIFDLATLQQTEEVIPFASIDFGINISTGPGLGIVAGFRLSPRGEYGNAVDAYTAWSEAVTVGFGLISVGVFISPQLRGGQEGWLGVVVMLGFEMGISGSLAYGVTVEQLAELMTDAMGEGVERVISTATAAGFAVGSAFASTAVAVAEGMGELAQQVAPIFASQRWGLDRFPSGVNVDPIHELAMWMQTAVAQRGLDAFLNDEGSDTPPSMDAWLAPLPVAGNLPTIYGDATAALNARYAALGNAGTIWEVSYFQETSYLRFIKFMFDNGVFVAT